VALGVWMGNSDHSAPTLGNAQIFATDGPGMVWHSFLREYMNNKPVAQFDPPPKGIVQKTIDAFSGGVPGPWTKDTTVEYFISGTEPGTKNAVDPPHLIYVQECGGWMVDPVRAENPGAPSTWKAADRDWAARAQKGQYVYGRWHTGTAYFWGRNSWGGPVVSGPCTAASPSPGASGGPTASPGVTPKPGHTPKPTPEPTPKHTPTPTHKPKPSKAPQGVQAVDPAVQADTPSGSPNAMSVALAKVVTQGLVNGVDVASEANLAARQGEGLDGNGSDDGRFPYSDSGLILPAIVPDPVATQPIRVGRRRSRLGRPHRPRVLHP
jgi:membrane peptidoglycan carboxypeptidase